MSEADDEVGQSDAELLCHFESLGRNCEFGFVQRLSGAEPMGLLRFAGLSFDALVLALNTRFAGITEPGNFELWVDNGEYRITARTSGFGYHTQIREGEIGENELFRIEYRKTRFLIAQILEDLDSQRKIFVYQQPSAMPAPDRAALLLALAGYGAVTLLCVVEADAGHRPGTVEKLSDVLMVGYVERLAPGGTVHQPHLPSWLDLCREAFRLWSADKAAAAAAAGRPPGGGPAAGLSEIGFGATGEARPFQVSGWSRAEQEHTWSVGPQSVLTLPRSHDSDLMLGLQVLPYVHPSHIAAQRLSVIVNGIEIVTFTVTTPSFLQCPVPASVLRRRDPVEVIFRHPDAARPSAVPSHSSDSRELAFAFQRVSLRWLQKDCIAVSPDVG